MFKKILTEKRRKAFKELEQEFKDEMVPVQYAEEEGLPPGVLSVFMDNIAAEGVESIGEFFFMPMEEEKGGIQLFINMITILENVNEKNLGELLGAIAIINSYVPLGAYSYAPKDGRLLFRYSGIMSADLSDVQLKEEMDRAMSVTMDTMEKFSYMLIEVNDGERTGSSIIDLFSTDEISGV